MFGDISYEDMKKFYWVTCGVYTSNCTLLEKAKANLEEYHKSQNKDEIIRLEAQIKELEREKAYLEWLYTIMTK